MFWQDHILLEWVLLTKIKTFETTGLICQNLGMEGKRRNQVCKTSVSQHIQDSHLLCWFFFLVHKRIPHCFWCDLLSPLLWQSVEAVGQTPASTSNVTRCMLHLQAPHQPAWKSSMKSKSGLFPRDLLHDHPCLFLPKRETTQDLSALQPSSRYASFGVLRFDWDAFNASTETLHSWECSDGRCFWPGLPTYFFHLSPFFLGSRDQRHIPG